MGSMRCGCIGVASVGALILCWSGVVTFCVFTYKGSQAVGWPSVGYFGYLKRFGEHGVIGFTVVVMILTLLMTIIGVIGALNASNSEHGMQLSGSARCCCGVMAGLFLVLDFLLIIVFLAILTAYSVIIVALGFYYPLCSPNTDGPPGSSYCFNVGKIFAMFDPTAKFGLSFCNSLTTSFCEVTTQFRPWYPYAGCFITILALIIFEGVLATTCSLGGPRKQKRRQRSSERSTDEAVDGYSPPPPYPVMERERRRSREVDEHNPRGSVPRLNSQVSDKRVLEDGKPLLQSSQSSPYGGVFRATKV